MEYKRLGRTTLKVSRIGFGCWAIGGHGYGRVDQNESIKSIHKALDLGINLFDTADVYGFGRSEEILAKALGSKKKDVIIATKFGVHWDENGNTYRDISPKRIVKALENSLRRLEIDCIKLYQIHCHDKKTPIEDVIEVLLKCHDSGKILHIGCCNFSKDLLIKACRNHRVESYQCLYNLAKRQNEDIIRYSSENLNIGVVVYRIIGRGVFSGKYDLESHFGENDTRMKDPDFHGAQYHKNILVAEKLREIGKKYAKSSTQVAIRWVLESPYITCALTGIKNRKQVSENVAAMEWSLDKNDMELIDSIVHDRSQARIICSQELGKSGLS